MAADESDHIFPADAGTETLNQRKEFMDALKIGKGKRLYHWGGAGLRVAKSGGGPGTADFGESDCGVVRQDARR